MNPSPSIYTYSNARHSYRLSAGIAQARIAALHSTAVTRPILSRYSQIARSHRRMRPSFAASRSRRPLTSASPNLRQNPHSARCTAGAQRPATSCLGAFWTPAATACGRVRHAGVQKPCMGLWKSSREFTACDFFLQLNFFVRLESPFLRPDPQCPNAVARRVCQGWPSLRYLLMLSAMPGHTLTNPSTAARSLWSGWTDRGELACRARTFVPQPCIRWGRNDPGP
jgi:hypothetical protein